MAFLLQSRNIIGCIIILFNGMPFILMKTVSTKGNLKMKSGQSFKSSIGSIPDVNMVNN